MDFRGVFPALITPFDSGGNVNCASLEALVEWHLSCGVSGFYVCGTTGEGMMLTDEERSLVVRTVVRAARGGRPSSSTWGRCPPRRLPAWPLLLRTLARRQSRASRPSSSDGAIAGACSGTTRGSPAPVPCPCWRTTCRVFWATSPFGDVLRVLDIDNVAGIKFSSYDFFMMRRIVEGRPDKVVLSGNDEVFFPALTMGAWGSIGLTLNFMPQLYVAIYKAFHDGDMTEGMRLQGCVNRVIEAVIDIFPLAAAKTVLSRMGFDVGIPRRPVRPFDDVERAEFLRRVEEAQLFQMVGRG